MNLPPELAIGPALGHRQGRSADERQAKKPLRHRREDDALADGDRRKPMLSLNWSTPDTRSSDSRPKYTRSMSSRPIHACTAAKISALLGYRRKASVRDRATRISGHRSTTGATRNRQDICPPAGHPTPRHPEWRSRRPSSGPSRRGPAPNAGAPPCRRWPDARGLVRNPARAAAPRTASTRRTLLRVFALRWARS